MSSQTCMYCTLYQTYFVNKKLDLEWLTIIEGKYVWYNGDMSATTFTI
jgi:hypothetical protein